MDSEKSITDKSAIEENCPENVEDLVTEHTHPKVTAKKTFFDLHHARRSRSAGTAETNYHPRIKWTAGTTEIGSTHQTTTTYSDYMEQDIMKPALEREASTADPVSTFLRISRSRLAPVTVTWGPMDIQPTRPEEIQHLLEPCPIISRPEIVQEVAKPKKKFLDKFRKRSKPVSSDSGEKVMPEASEVGKILPEEEFRLLNERYIREGIIPVETIKKHEYFAASLQKFTLENSEASNALRNLENEDRISDPSHNIDKDGRISLESFFQDKVIPSDKNIHEVESTSSPLPARRSCEPVDIKDLRKLRDSDSKPGPSGINQQENGQGVKHAFFTTRSPKMSIFDPRADVDEVEVPHSESQESLQGTTNGTSCKVDCFKIDNPFSDFSLQTIKQQETMFKKQIPESPIKKKPQRRDSKVPSTSKATHSMEYRPKVSYNPNVKKPDKTLTVTSSQRLVDKFSKKGGMEVQPKQRAVDQTLGFTFLTTIMHQITGQNIILTQIFLKTDAVDSDDRKMIFDYCNPNFQSVLTPLLENVINPTFNNFLKNHLPNLSTRLDEPSSKIISAKNYAWNDIIEIFSNACPKAINNILNISHIWNKNIDSTEKENTNTNRDFTKLLNSPECMQNVFFPLKSNSSVQMDKVMEKIVDYVVNVALWQDLIPEFLFLSFSPKATLISNRRHFEGSYRFYSRLENYQSFPLNPVAFPVEIFYLYKTSFHFKKLRDFQRRDNASDIALALFANFTAFPASLGK